MKLRLVRKEFSDVSTIGELAIDGEHFCFTLEDVVRSPGSAKVPGRTAIPAGVYQIEMTESPRFSRVLPLVEGVPGFSGIRIHGGNKAEDTEGCILVGDVKGPDWIAGAIAHHVLDGLIERLAAAAGAGDPIAIEIVEARGAPWEAT